MRSFTEATFSSPRRTLVYPPSHEPTRPNVGFSTPQPDFTIDRAAVGRPTEVLLAPELKTVRVREEGPSPSPLQVFTKTQPATVT